MTTNKIKASEVHEILGHYMLADGYNMVIDPEKSRGSYMYDAKSGKEYLDFFSFFASMPLGFNHPRMRDESFIREIGEVALHKISNSDFYTTTFAQFVKTMGEVAMPSYMKKMFFVSGGALAVENALKVAFDWKVRKNMERGIEGEKGSKIIHFKEAFHGRTGYTLSLTNTSDPRKYMYFPKFDWPRVLNPKAIFPLEGENLSKTIEMENITISQIEEAVRNNPNDIAGLVIEPIQGEGGDNHFRIEFMKKLRELADRHEFLLIFDEVQSGGGITGRMWAHEHYGVKPDLICFGKKFQTCGIMAGERVFEVKNNCFEESSRINSTWGGNLVDMVRVTRYLEIIRDEKLVENAFEMGAYLLHGLQKLKEDYGKIENLRGKGLFVAFDMATAEMRDRFLKICMEEENMIILPCGNRSVRFRPYLDVKKADIEEGLERMARALSKCE